MKIEELLPQEAFSAIGKIASCMSQFEVHRLTKQAINCLGADSFVYSSLIINDDDLDRPSYRYMIGCDPQWCHIYNQNKWYINDPFIKYARENTEPVLGSQIPLATEGQRTMLKTAALYGYRSVMIIPTHNSSSSNERLGVLYIGSSDNPGTGEIVFNKNRLFFRSLGMELLDWWIKYIRQESMLKFKLSELDVALMQYLKNGLSIADVSGILGIKDKKLYERMSSIRDAFNVDKNNAALVLAQFHGLLK